MKFTLSWLKDHLDTTASLDDIVTTLSAIGLEVDGIEDPGAKLDAFTVARVLSAKKHPDADKLQVLQVETEKGKPPLEIVCGAPNAREGMLAVFAPIGTYVPGLDITLTKKPVRGVISNGMMCSDAELELSEESEGIIDVDPSFAGRVGERYADVMGLNDPVIEVGLTPNRPDCTGVRGIARDLAAAGLGTLKDETKLTNVEGTKKCPVAISLEFSEQDAHVCPVFAGRVVTGVTNGPSPSWLANRLRAIGLRPINALVDITNYISFDRGRPLHVYDLKTLQGSVRARMGEAGTSFLGLDGKTYDVDSDMCVIADESGPLGFGGVMGGETTGCTETTTDVLIECAWFDPVSIAQTGRKTGLVTDARYRFERGVDPQSVLPGLDLATHMIMDICGGTPTKKTVAGKAPNPKTVIPFEPARVVQLTGLDMKPAAIKDTLSRLGFTVTGKGKALKVSVPTWRPDVHGAADLVEEVVRIAGIDNIPSVPMPRMSGIARAVLTSSQKRARRTKRVLAGRGMVEAITWSFVSHEEATVFGGGADALELSNPISVEMSSMRPSLLPGLLSAVQRNRNHGTADVAVFEQGSAYRGTESGDQALSASGVRAGTAAIGGAGRHWDGNGAPVSVFDVKADVFAVLAALGVNTDNVQVSRSAPEWFHPGRSGTVQLGPKTVLAHFGEVHPKTLSALDVDPGVCAFEIFLDALPPEKKRKSRARPALANLDLQPVTRDFAFVVECDVAAQDVLKAARGADRKHIADVRVFDVFDGGQLASEGKKSLAIEVTLQPSGATFTDEDIEAIAARIVAAVGKATGGEIRG